MPTFERRRPVKAIVLAIALLLLLASVTFAMRRPPIVALSELWLGTVEVGDVEKTVSGQGMLIPGNLVTISSASGGTVSQLHQHAGAVVARNQLLVSLDSPELKQKLMAAEKVHAEDAARLAQMESELLAEQLDLEAAASDLEDQVSLAEYELAGMADLAAKNVISVLQHRKAEAAATSLNRKLKQARSRLEQFKGARVSRTQAVRLASELGRQELLALRKQQEDLQVRSPEAGVLYELAENVTEGAPILPGSIVARISTSDTLDVELKVSSSVVAAIAPGEQMTVDTGRKELIAKVTRIDPRAIQGDVRVTASLLKSEPGLELRPGQAVTGWIVTGTVPNRTYVIKPIGVDEHSESTVFVLSEDGKYADRVAVKFAGRVGKFLEIESGLKRGQRVVLSDVKNFKNTDRLRLDNE